MFGDKINDRKIEQGKHYCRGEWSSYQAFGYDRHLHINEDNDVRRDAKVDAIQAFLTSIGIKFGVGEDGEFSYNPREKGLAKVSLKEGAYEKLRAELGRTSGMRL